MNETQPLPTVDFETWHASVMHTDAYKAATDKGRARMAWQASQGTPAPVGVEPVEFSQFLSDVMTAAGLVTHGKQCKDLGVRLGDMCSRLRADQVLAMGRVPLSPEQVKAITLDAGYDDFEMPDPERAAFINGIRHGEVAHGIKQGGA